tara:strand:- start:275 stop:685 length:411 start_codon:yes stop_codon:yes gene_type:complete
MQSLFLKGSKTTPEFNYDIENFSMSIIGESNIDELNPFYNTITKFLNTVETIKPRRLNLDIKLDSICLNSKRGIVFFLMRLKEIQVNCKSALLINWYYNTKNKLMRTIGEDLEQMVMLKINVLSIKSKESPSLEPA